MRCKQKKISHTFGFANADSKDTNNLIWCISAIMAEDGEQASHNFRLVVKQSSMSDNMERDVIEIAAQVEYIVTLFHLKLLHGQRQNRYM